MPEWSVGNAEVNLFCASYFNVKYVPNYLQTAEFNHTDSEKDTRVSPKVSGLAVWSENCKWYSSLPLGAVVSLFCESV
jgi:hypothetical protein